MPGAAYKQTQLEDRWDVIVIGSGMGGLTAAALLARHAGRRVLVLERHYTAGGFTHVFNRPGFDWDVGLHYIGQTEDPASPVRAAFDRLTDGQLQWHSLPDVYDEIRIAGKTYPFPKGRERFRESLLQAFPNEGPALNRYLDAVRQCAEAGGLYYAEKAVPSFISKLAGRFMRAKFLHWANRTTAEVLAEITSNRELIGVLTAQWGDYGLPPAQSSFAAHATIAQHYLNGAAYPVGGAERLAATILPAIERTGGRVVVGAEVAQVLLDKSGRAQGVRMEDGREFQAPVVVSDAGALNTFGRLLPAGDRWRDELFGRVKEIGSSMSYFCLYVGLDRTSEELGLNGTNLWILPGPDHDANVARFSADPDAEFPVLFVSFPSAKDPEFTARHPGHSTIEVITLAPYRWFASWENTRWKRRGADYDALKQRFTTRLREDLERHVPSVRGHIKLAELSTPLSVRHFANYPAGEAYGLRATPARFRLRELGARTPVPGLFLAGQDVAMLGVTGAMFGGAIAASAILGRNLVGKVSKPYRRK